MGQKFLKYGSIEERRWERIWKICKGVWREEAWPKEWRIIINLLTNIKKHVAIEANRFKKR